MAAEGRARRAPWGNVCAITRHGDAEYPVAPDPEKAVSDVPSGFSAIFIHPADLCRIMAGTSLSPAMTWPMATRIARLLPESHTPWRFLEGLARHPYPPEHTFLARTAR